MTQNNTPKERPILFSAPMVRAILDGKKTQTRRVVKLPRWSTQRWEDLEIDSGPCPDANNEPFCPYIIAKVSGCLADIPCPYGVPGDRLWVRETWCLDDPEYAPQTPPTPRPMKDGRFPWYAATESDVEGRGDKSPWKPSIHMPRWASRILLSVVSVRVERLQEISEEDALAEGVGDRDDTITYPITAYANLWDRINGERASWASNPWVWVVEFRRVQP